MYGELEVCDTCVNVLGYNIRWDQAPCRREQHAGHKIEGGRVMDDATQKRNPYRRIERWAHVAWGVLMVGLTVALLGLIGWFAVLSIGWWVLLTIPGLVVLFVIVDALVWLSVTAQRRWWRKKAAWDRKNGAE